MDPQESETLGKIVPGSLYQKKCEQGLHESRINMESLKEFIGGNSLKMIKYDGPLAPLVGSNSDYSKLKEKVWRQR